MEFKCPVCEIVVPYDLQIIIPHAEEHIIDEIKKKHPDWVQNDGICKKCYEYYKSQMRPGR